MRTWSSAARDEETETSGGGGQDLNSQLLLIVWITQSPLQLHGSDHLLINYLIWKIQRDRNWSEGQTSCALSPCELCVSDPWRAPAPPPVSPLLHRGGGGGGGSELHLHRKPRCCRRHGKQTPTFNCEFQSRNVFHCKALKCGLKVTLLTEHSRAAGSIQLPEETLMFICFCKSTQCSVWDDSNMFLHFLLYFSHTHTHTHTHTHRHTHSKQGPVQKSKHSSIDWHLCFGISVHASFMWTRPLSNCSPQSNSNWGLQ